MGLGYMIWQVEAVAGRFQGGNWSFFLMINRNDQSQINLSIINDAMRTGFITILAMLFTIILTGCSSQSSTNSSQIGPGYQAGQMYTLTCDVFISKKPAQIIHPGLTPQDKWSPYYLNPPADDAVTPRSISDYEKEPTVWPQVQGIVPAGSKIKYLFTGTSLQTTDTQIGFPFFEIQTGPYANFVVDGSLVSILGRADILTPQADPRYLKPATQ